MATMTTDNITWYRYEGMAKAAERYKRWWVGKMCRQNSHKEFKKVKSVELCGNPSFVYGIATLVFEDGTKENIITGSYVPRKYDVEVQS
jgi:hypothetical protein